MLKLPDFLKSLQKELFSKDRNQKAFIFLLTVHISNSEKSNKIINFFEYLFFKKYRDLVIETFVS